MEKTELQSGFFKFTVKGEYITDLSRSLFVDGNIKTAFQILVGDMEGMTDEIAIAILSGKNKMVGDNEFVLEKDNIETYLGIPLDLEKMWYILANRYMDNLSTSLIIKQRITDLASRRSDIGSAYRYGLDYPYSLESDRKLYNSYNEKFKDIAENLSILSKYINKSISDLPIHNLCIETGIKPDNDCSRTGKDFDYYLTCDLDNFEAEPKIIATYKNLDVFDILKRRKNIEEKLKGVLKPNPITDMNSAGWLEPNGNWYGLNGEISDNLHNNLSDALVDNGIVKFDRTKDVNIDNYLLKNGWIKIHGKKVYFEGHYYNVLPTLDQIHKLKVYSERLSPPFILMGHSLKSIGHDKLSDISPVGLTSYFQY